MYKFKLNNQIPFKTIQNYDIFFKVKTIGVSYNKNFKNSKNNEVFLENEENYFENLELYSNILFYWYIPNNKLLVNESSINLNFLNYFNKLLLYEDSYKFNKNSLNLLYDNKEVFSYYFLQNINNFLYYYKKNNYILGRFFLYNNKIKLLIFYFFNLNKFIKLNTKNFLLSKKNNIYKLLKKNKLWFVYKNKKFFNLNKKKIKNLYNKRYYKIKSKNIFLSCNKYFDLFKLKFETKEVHEEIIKNNDKKKIKKKLLKKLFYFYFIKKKMYKYNRYKIKRLSKKNIRRKIFFFRKRLKNTLLNNISKFKNKNLILSKNLKKKIIFLKKFIAFNNLIFIKKKYKINIFNYINKKPYNIKRRRFFRSSHDLAKLKKKRKKNKCLNFKYLRLKLNLRKIKKRINFLIDENIELNIDNNLYYNNIIKIRLLKFRNLIKLKNYYNYFIELDKNEQKSDLLQFYFKSNSLQKVLKNINIRFLNFIFSMKSRTLKLKKLRILKKKRRKKVKQKKKNKIKNFLYLNKLNLKKEFKLFFNLFEKDQDNYIDLLINQHNIKKFLFINSLKLKHLKFNQFILMF